MRDNMLVNMTGHPGHYMGVDLNMEHNINYQKATLISSCISSNDLIKKLRTISLAKESTGLPST